MPPAHAITAARVLLTPAFILAVVRERTELGLAIFVLVAVSDLADGAVARRTGTTSERGRIWDHIADIAFLVPTLTLFAWRGVVTPWVAVVAGIAFSHYLVVAWREREGKLVLPPSRLGHLGGVLNYCVAGAAAAAPLARPLGTLLPGLGWVAVAANGLSVLSRWLSPALAVRGRQGDRLVPGCLPTCRKAGPLILAALTLAGACTPQRARYTVRRAGVDCVEASRLAYETLVGLGYRVQGFELARPGQPGLVAGVKEGKDAAVEIACDAEGITATPEPGEILPDLEFVRGFHFAYTYRLDHPPPEEPLPPARKASAPALAARSVTGGVRVTVRPRPGLEAKSYIGVDPTAAGLLPVEVTVTNGEGRTVRLRSAAVVLVTRDGRRVRPVTREEVRAKLGEAADRVLQDQVLEGGAAAAGFLFYPLGDYRGARTILEDAATGETEGFLTEF